MDAGELEEHARRNRETFEEVLGAYVETKLEQVMGQQGDAGWLDASGCVWCVFDDEAFLRAADEGRRLASEQGKDFGLSLFWSMGDVAMPGPCDEEWVATRIEHEARSQLRARGLVVRTEERVVDGERHLGVTWRKRHLPWGRRRHT